MIWIFGALAVAAALIAGVGWYMSAPGYEGPESDHFNGTTFENIGGVDSKNLWEVLKWSLNREQGEWVERTAEEVPPGAKPADRVSDGFVLTYVNHSTFLIQTDGLNILTDPVWSERVSPFSFAGPRRMRPPGIRFEDLPAIDLVLVSHNHYDHLDIATLKDLNDAHAAKFIVPLGVDLYLKQQGISNTTAIDWWEDEAISEAVTVSGVPAQHFSARGMFDRDKTLWMGFVLQTSFGNIFFAGDTGYGPFFPEIGERYAPIKMGLIPIGAYKPRWFMSPVHVDPEEAIQVHKDVQAEISFGMHYGTFPLADDGMNDPQRDFSEAIQKPENQGVNFKLLKEGDRFSVVND